MRYWVYVGIVLVSLIIHEGYALSCYGCDSKSDPDCKEHFDHENIDSLTVKSTECTVDAAKYCIKTTGVWGGVVGTTRFCSSRDMGNQCQFIRYPDHDRVYRACIYTCGRDHCNTATSTYQSIALLFTALTLSVLALWRT